MADANITLGLYADDAMKTADKLEKQLEEVFSGSGKGELSASIDKLVNSMKNAYIRAEELKGEMLALQNAKVPTTAYRQLSGELAKLDQEYQRIREKQWEMEDAGKTKSPQYTALLRQLEEINRKSEEVRLRMEQLKASGQAFASAPNASEKYDELKNDLIENNNEMARLLRQAGLLSNIPAPTGQVSVLESKVAALGEKFIALAKSAPIAILQSLGRAAVRAAKQVMSLAKSLIKITANSIKNGISKISSAIRGVGKSASKSDIDLKKITRTLVKYVFGFRSFFFLYKRIRSSVVEGFGSMAQYSGELNNKISQLVTSFNYLKNALTTAFAPIVNYVSPILSRLIDKVAQATTAVGQFFAALLGQTSFIKARKVYQDYAQSLDKSSKQQQQNATQTQKKVEKLEKTIAGFDDVEILKEPDKDNDSGSDSSPSADTGSGLNPWEDPQNLFEKVDIPEKFKDLVDKLKKMWRDADFTELGRILGEKLRDALNNIPWDKIKEVLRKIAKSIATFLNGFLETPGLFDAIGRTLAQALNSAFEFLNAFAKNFHFDSLGYAIRDGILGALNNIDWPLIYETCARWGSGIGTTINAALENPDIWIRIFDSIAKSLNALLIKVNAFVSKVHWGSIAYHIANGMNHGMDTFNWGLLGDTLVKVLNGAFDFLYKWLSTFNFYKFGSYIGQTISKVLKETDWTTFGAMLGAFVDGLLDLLRGIFDQVEWKDLAKAVTDTINGFFSEFDWDEHKDTLDLVGTGLFRVLGIIFDMIPWGKIANKIIDTIKETLYKVDWFKVLLGCLKLIVNALIVSIDVSYGLIFDAAGDIIKGLLKGITAALTGIGDWVYKNIFKPIFNAIKKAFGISSPAKEMEPIGVNIVEGLKKGITSVIDSVREKADNIKDKIKGVFNKEKWETLGTNLLDKIKNGVGNNSKIQTILSSVNSITTSMKNKFGEVNWTTLGENLAQGIGNGIANKLEFLKTTAWNLAVNMYNKACEALGIHSPSTVFRDKVGKMITAGLAEGVEDSAYQAMNAVSSLSDNLVNAAATDIKIPAIVSGEIVPYSLGKTNTNDTNNTLNKLMEMLQYNQDRTITRDELMAMLIDLFTRYLNIDFYIGDEQIARHANAGNQRLDRRYKPASI